jgi:hypothetical protein
VAALVGSCSSHEPQQLRSVAADDSAYVGQWTLVAKDMNGVRVYLDRMGVHTAGDRKVADLGYVSSTGRRLVRQSFGCSDDSIAEISSIGDPVTTLAPLIGNSWKATGKHSIADYVCLRAHLPREYLNSLPKHS